MDVVVVRSVAFVVACITCSACSFEPGRYASDTDPGGGGRDDDAAVDAWLSGYTYRKPITVSPPALGGSLSEFPIAVALTSDADLAARARDDGTDLVVTASDGASILPHELVATDAATERLEMWVRVPMLELAGATTLYLYYGGPARSATPPTVWAAPFASVWHMGGTAGTPDSAALGNHLTVAATDTAPAAAPGIAGAARAMSLTTDRLTHVDNDTLDFASTSFSYSLWVKEAVASGTFDMPFYKGGTNTCCPGYGILLGTGVWDAKLHDGGTGNTEGDDYRDATFGDHDAIAPTNRWVHLAAVVDRTAQTLTTYADGALTDTVSISGIGPLTSAQDLAIGRAPVGSSFIGAIDEVRIYGAALPAAWFAVEHANLTAPSFVVLGAQQAP